jgi:hypothetical protein
MNSKVGTRLWRIICLIIHFLYSRQSPQDALHHQRQAILRNSSNPESSLFKLAYLAFAWRNNATKPYTRLLAVVVMALLCVVGFTLASGFSSQVSIGIGTEVLLSGDKCAIIDESKHRTADLTERQTFFSPYHAKMVNNWDNYAQQCYQSNNSSTATLFGCGTFVKGRLTSSVTTNAKCPFNETICQNQDRNIRIDTGFLDSHHDFGLNAPPQNRFQFRKITECAPIKSEGYTTKFNISKDRSYTQWPYGGNYIPGGFNNITYAKSNDALFEKLAVNGRGDTSDYSVA